MIDETLSASPIPVANETIPDPDFSAIQARIADLKARQAAAEVDDEEANRELTMLRDDFARLTVDRLRPAALTPIPIPTLTGFDRFMLATRAFADAWLNSREATCGR